MSVPAAHEMLQSEIGSLPDSLTDEVPDFALFARVRHKEKALLRDQVAETGAYREAHRRMW